MVDPTGDRELAHRESQLQIFEIFKKRGQMENEN